MGRSSTRTPGAETSTGRAERQLRQLQDLARLRTEFRFLLALVALELPVHQHVPGARLLRAEFFHPRRSRARDRLVGRKSHAPKAGRVVQRLQRADELDGGAVRVGDDPVVLERSLAVHLGHDERHAVHEPERRGLVHAYRAAPARVRYELAARGRADGEEAEVEVTRRERLRCRLLDDETLASELD